MKDILNHILKSLNLDAETVKALTADDAKAEEATKLFDEKFKVIDEARTEEIKKGLTPELRKELKTEIEKGLVPETLKKFKKEVAKALGVAETGTKIADSTQEEFVSLLNEHLVPKKTVEEQNEENTKLKEKLRATIEDHDTIKEKLDTLEKEIPVKYVEKSALDEERINTKKAEKISALKDMPVDSEQIAETLEGRLLLKGWKKSWKDGEIILIDKEGKEVVDDKFKPVTLDTVLTGVAESLKPKSGGTPKTPAGGGGAGGDDGKDKYVSPAQQRMLEEQNA